MQLHLIYWMTTLGYCEADAQFMEGSFMPSRGSAEEKRQKAQSHFDKADQRQREGAKAQSEAQIKREAESVKTARLRALRLAKEAADALAAKALRAEKETSIAIPRKRRQKDVLPGKLKHGA